VKAFLLRCSLFLVPLAAGVIAIFSAPYDKGFGYGSMFPGCGNQGSWLYNRVFINPKKIDVAFIGSSHTMNAVNDACLRDLSQQNGVALEFTNLGFCRTGRDLQYTLAKDLLSRKKIKLLVIEVTERESYWSHPDFPYIASTHDLLRPVVLNSEYPRIVIDGLTYRWEYSKNILFDNSPQEDTNTMSDHGFRGHDHIADKEQLVNAERQSRERFSDTSDHFTLPYSRDWLKAIIDLADESHVRIAFLYLPGYGTPLKKPLENSWYSSYGQVITLPDSVRERQDFWYDDAHFNDRGAKALAPYLYSEISLILDKTE
jgi:hypothetical protein